MSSTRFGPAFVEGVLIQRKLVEQEEILAENPIGRITAIYRESPKLSESDMAGSRAQTPALKAPNVLISNPLQLDGKSRSVVEAARKQAQTPIPQAPMPTIARLQLKEKNRSVPLTPKLKAETPELKNGVTPGPGPSSDAKEAAAKIKELSIIKDNISDIPNYILNFFSENRETIDNLQIYDGSPISGAKWLCTIEKHPFILRYDVIKDNCLIRDLSLVVQRVSAWRGKLETKGCTVSTVNKTVDLDKDPETIDALAELILHVQGLVAKSRSSQSPASFSLDQPLTSEQ